MEYIPYFMYGGDIFWSLILPWKRVILGYITCMAWIFLALQTSMVMYDSLENTSSVPTMNAMFNDASNFNGDVSSSDTSRGTALSYMFSDATSFNGHGVILAYIHSNTHALNVRRRKSLQADAILGFVQGWHNKHV